MRPQNLQLFSKGNPRAQEKHFTSLGEELLALDQRDSQVVPQLMRLQPHSARALSKALATCSADLTLLVLLHSYEHIVREELRMDASSVGGASTRGGYEDDEAHFAPFYAFLRDVAAGGARGLLAEQADGVWHAFVQGMAAPLPHAGRVRTRLTSGAYAMRVHLQPRSFIKSTFRRVSVWCRALCQAALHNARNSCCKINVADKRPYERRSSAECAQRPRSGGAPHARVSAAESTPRHRRGLGLHGGARRHGRRRRRAQRARAGARGVAWPAGAPARGVLCARQPRSARKQAAGQRRGAAAADGARGGRRRLVAGRGPRALPCASGAAAGTRDAGARAWRPSVLQTRHHRVLLYVFRYPRCNGATIWAGVCVPACCRLLGGETVFQALVVTSCSEAPSHAS